MKANIEFNVTGEIVEMILANAAANRELEKRVAALEAQPPTEPPPDPEPPPPTGEVVFSCDFTEEEFPEWTQEPASDPLYFELGNAKTHGGPETGPDGQTTSLRMKLGPCIKPAGCFPRDTYAEFRREFDLAAGTYQLEAYQVQHDEGEFFILVNGSPLIIGAWAAGEASWDKSPDAVFDHPGGLFRLWIGYGSPASGTQESGIKMTGLRVRRVA